MTPREAAARLSILMCAALIAAVPYPASAQSAPTASEFLYRTKNRDTLIGLGRRLLREPLRWRDLQILNRIGDPRRIPLGTTIRIPYALLRMSAEPATVVGVAGTVLRDGAALRPSDTVPQGSVLETGADGSVTLSLADGSIVTLQKSSTLQLDALQGVTGAPEAHDIRFSLRRGRLQTVVKPHGGVGRFEIETPVAVSAARGTEFRAAFDTNGGHALTETLEGTVSVAGSGGSVMVPADFGTHVEAGAAPPAPVRLLPPPDLSGIPATSTSAQLHVEWQSVVGAAAYRLQLAPDAQFRTLLIDTKLDTSATTLPAPADGSYWLRVRSIDSNALEGPDAVRQLVQRTAPPPPPPARPVPRVLIAAHTLQVSWDAHAWPRYRLQIARDPGFTHLVLDRTVDATEMATPRPWPGRYYARIQPIDASGAPEQSGPVTPFEVPVPRWVEIALPIAALLTLLL